MKREEISIINHPNKWGIHIWQKENIITFEYWVPDGLVTMKINLKDIHLTNILSKISIKSKKFNKHLEKELIRIVNDGVIYDDYEDLTILDLIKFELEKERVLVI